MGGEAFRAEGEAVEYGNPLLHLHTFIHGLSRLVDQGATVPLGEVQAALEGDRLGKLLAGLKEGDPFSGVPVEERIWILEGLANAGLLAEEMEAVPYQNGLLWLLELAVDMLFHGEMP